MVGKHDVRVKKLLMQIFVTTRIGKSMRSRLSSVSSAGKMVILKRSLTALDSTSWLIEAIGLPDLEICIQAMLKVGGNLNTGRANNV